MSGRSDWEDELLALVKDAAKDIVFDQLDKDASVTIEEVESGTDDGTVYGGYKLRALGHTITITASACFGGEQDCWSWGSESHYTKPVTFDSLQDFEYEVESVKKDPEYNYDEEMENAEIEEGEE